MQTKDFIGDSHSDPNSERSNRPQPPIGPAPIGRKVPVPANEETAPSEELLIEIARLRLIVYALPPAEHVVIRALHGLDCERLPPKRVARLLEIPVAEVHAIEATAMARIHLFFGFEEAA